ncbi:CDP-2,3-bis-(O-geranylgeranyl)-sn-glycerol synthase [Candidatus Woesearchaeota archaeon]|nr:CDP-2,3-bis-(O-geranylgeranyl)-sn-glycerol synthase [Candidatus Woesearchaeota archaeon]
MLKLILSAIIFILPAYIANSTPVIAGKLLGKYNAPISKKILGKGKTWGGLIFGLLAGTLAGYFLNALYLGFLLSLGALLGDIIGSFIKRRFGLKRGTAVPLLDQYDFLIIALAFASYIKTPTLIQLIIILILTPLLHISTNFIAFTLKLKKEWW